MRSMYMAALVLGLSGCPGSSGTPVGGDTGIDTDADTSIDTDTGIDIDIDTDTGIDTDTDTDTEATTFACDELDCQADEICVIVVGGVRPPEGEDGRTPSCQPAPEACADAPTCDCANEADVCPEFAGSCDDSGDGVECMIFAP